MTPERKAELISTFARSEGDTGSPEVQIALLTERINHLTDHFRTHHKDHASRRGRLMMVARRRGLLDYLKGGSFGRYKSIIKELGLRK